MKRHLWLGVGVVLVAGGALFASLFSRGLLPSSSPSLSSTTYPAGPQVGVNFIRYFFGDSGTGGVKRRHAESSFDTSTDYLQPTTIFADYQTLGVEAERQLVKADLGWETIEPVDNQWNFSVADQIIGQSPAEPIVTLFRLQYASPTPPWAKPGEFQTTLGEEAKDYLDHVIGRYGKEITYWEIGNEMDHWRALDASEAPRKNQTQEAELPAVVPTNGFTPEQQGAFLSEVADYIRARDEDAIIVMPGMGSISEGTLNSWLAGVLEGAGKDTFDVINYHDYGPWDQMIQKRSTLESFLQAHDLSDKPVWLTETGSTSEPTLTTRTNYPNSQISQAADVFRRLIPAYAAGDDLVIWHTYISSPVMAGNTWGEYGLRSADGQQKLSYWAFQLLTHELLPFSRVEKVDAETTQYIYRITTATGAKRYVVWGSGRWLAPTAGRYTSVATSSAGTFSWQDVQEGKEIPLTDTPLLFETP